VVGKRDLTSPGKVQIEDLGSARHRAIDTRRAGLNAPPSRTSSSSSERPLAALASSEPETARRRRGRSRRHRRRLSTRSRLSLLTCGLGGGTGSGAARHCRNARAAGLYGHCLAAMPSALKGNVAARREQAWVNLRAVCDAVITLPNDLLCKRTAIATRSWTCLVRPTPGCAEALARSRPSPPNGLVSIKFRIVRKIFHQCRGGRALVAVGAGERSECVEAACAPGCVHALRSGAHQRATNCLVKHHRWVRASMTGRRLLAMANTWLSALRQQDESTGWAIPRRPQISRSTVCGLLDDANA
jgi:cell division GTPase FtsZ